MYYVNLFTGYRKAIIRQNKMRRATYEGEERLGVVERNIRELEKRLYEKQEFLREIKTFKLGDSIEEAARMDQVLIEKKQLYKDNYDVGISLLLLVNNFHIESSRTFLMSS